MPRRPVHSVKMLSSRLLNALESPRAYERDFVSSSQTQDRPLSFHQWQNKQIINILCVNLWQRSLSPPFLNSTTITTYLFKFLDKDCQKPGILKKNLKVTDTWSFI